MVRKYDQQTAQPQSKRYKGCRWLATLLIVLLPTGGQSAEEDSVEDAQPPAETTEQAEATEPVTATEDGTEPPAEIFLPTEEISEDYAAPFPVDI